MIWIAEEVWFWGRFVPRPRLRLERFSSQLSLAGSRYLRRLLFTFILSFFYATVGIYHLFTLALYEAVTKHAVIVVAALSTPALRRAGVRA